MSPFLSEACARSVGTRSNVALAAVTPLAASSGVASAFVPLPGIPMDTRLPARVASASIGSPRRTKIHSGS